MKKKIMLLLLVFNLAGPVQAGIMGTTFLVHTSKNPDSQEKLMQSMTNNPWLRESTINRINEMLKDPAYKKHEAELTALLDKVKSLKFR